MAKTRVKTWTAEVLTAADLNAEFDNIINTPMALISPATASLDMNAQTIIMDADQDTTIKSDTDNQIDFTVAGALVANFKAAVFDLNGNRMDFNTDGDSSLRESSDDVIALELQAFDSIIFDGDVATPVNGLTFQTAATGNPASILPHGEAGCSLKIEFADDLDSSLRETADDIVALELQGFDSFIFDGNVASPVNGLTFISSATGVAPQITDHGENNNGINLAPSGSGTVLIGGGTLAGTCYNGSTSWDPASLADGFSEPKNITVTGAAFGDFVMMSASVSMAGMTLTGTVSSSNTVTAVLTNHSGGVKDLASFTVYARVLSRT
jgi:hypothetical protein